MPAASPALAAAREVAPPLVLGIALVLVGILALGAVASRRVLDRPGDYAMAGLMGTALWSAAGYVWAIIATAGEDVRMASAAAVWMLVARIHWIVLGWPEPPRLPRQDDGPTTPVRLSLEELQQLQERLEERRRPTRADLEES